MNVRIALHDESNIVSLPILVIFKSVLACEQKTKVHLLI